MSRIPSDLRAVVRHRAAGRCEYCLLHENDAHLQHEPDHIIALKHGGATEPDNLAYACFFCNRYKGSDIGSIDQLTGELIGLFNPRRHRWTDHFAINVSVIVPLTAEARVTIRILQLNHPDRILERSAIGTWP